MGDNVKEEEDSGDKRHNEHNQMNVDVESKENIEEVEQITLNPSVARRYPRRNIAKKQYFEEILPKDDEYLCEHYYNMI